MNGKKIKIIHIIPTLDMGGAERLLVDVVKNLDQNNFSVSIICLKRFGFWGMELKKQGTPLILAGLGNGFGIFGFLNLIKILKKENPDIVHAHLFGADFFGVLAAKLVGIKNIVSTEHNLNYQENWLKKILKKWSLNFTKNIVAVSGAVKTYAIAVGIPAEKIRVIYNGVETEKFLDLTRKYEKKNKITIGSLGRLTEQKGFDFLIEVLAILKDKKINCLLAGEGEDRGKLEKQIKKVGLSERVKLLGWQKNTKEFFDSLDIFILPSRWEGFGLAILEAGLAGLPVIASRVDGIKEIIEDKVDGLLFKKENVEELAEKIRYLTDNPEERKKLGVRLQNKAKEKFSIKKIVKDYENLYLELLK
jgi:glycosyltransferase involved in cell wall biosynthesis